MVRAMVELQAGALWLNGVDCVSSAGSDESFHRAAGGLSPEPRRGSGGVLDGHGGTHSFVIALNFLRREQVYGERFCLPTVC